MKCQEFEELISDYLEGQLAGEVQTEFAEHMMACVDCRGLADEVRSTILYCREDRSVEIRPAFEAQILSLTKQASLPLELPAIDCTGCENLFTEFLDGYVAAPTYHAFEIHIQACASCSDLLTDMVMAVASCHSVHSEESFDVSELLVQRILSETCLGTAEPVYKMPWRERISMMLSPIFHPLSVRQWATAMVILLASSAVLLMQFSDDHSLAGVYRKGNVAAGRAYSWTAAFLGRNGAVVDDVKSSVDEGISKIQTGFDDIKQEEQKPSVDVNNAQPAQTGPANVPADSNNSTVPGNKKSTDKNKAKKANSGKQKAQPQSRLIPGRGLAYGA